jgi:hypothetical protein
MEIHDKRTVSRQFDETELQDLEHKVYETLQEINIIEDEKKAYLEPLKLRIKKLNGNLQNLIEQRNNSCEVITYDCLGEPNFENNRMEFFDKLTGNLIDSRPLKSTERQSSFLKAVNL